MGNTEILKGLTTQIGNSIIPIYYDLISKGMSISNIELTITSVLSKEAIDKMIKDKVSDNLSKKASTLSELKEVTIEGITFRITDDFIISVHKVVKGSEYSSPIGQISYGEAELIDSNGNSISLTEEEFRICCVIERNNTQRLRIPGD